MPRFFLFLMKFFLMAKLNISGNFLTIVLHQEFIVFSLNLNTFSWNFEKVVKCTDNFSNSDGSIECCAFSPCGKYFGVCFDKSIIIYITSDWSTLHVCSGERKASSLQFLPKSKVILIADKSGCATFYFFNDNELKKSELALGHNSMLTGALITADEKFVITSDRDEKIRVTHYPNVYNIEKYCLGHDVFVSCIGFLPMDNRVLISSSGDGTLRFWNYIQGQELDLYNCNDYKNNENHKATVIKFVASKVNQMSVVAILEYKSNQIKIISIKGDLNTSLKIELVKVITLRCVPWDMAWCSKTLVFLLPDKHNPLVIWSADLPEPKENFKNIALHLSENWDPFITTSNKIVDNIPVLFKREVDNLQEYEKRKKFRMLKTGKTS